MKQKNFFRVLCIILLSMIYAASYAQFGNALNFDGSNDYVIGEHFNLPGYDEYTIEFWFKTDMTPQGGTFNDNGTPDNLDDDEDFVGGNWYCFFCTTEHPKISVSQKNAIVTWSSSTNGIRSYDINADYGEIVYGEWDNSQEYSRDFWSYNSGAFSTVANEIDDDNYENPVLNNDEWHHIAITKKIDEDDTNYSKYIIYTDGQWYGILNYLNNGNSSVRWENNVFSTDTDFFTIGAQRPIGFQHFLNATLDELRIWDYAKSRAQIHAQMNKQLTGDEDNYSNLVAYYKFNEGSAGNDNTNLTEVTNEVGGNGTFSDNFALTGNGSNFVSGVTENDFINFNVDTENDNAIHFDGTNYVDLDFFDKPDNFTAEFWIKLEQDIGRTHIFHWYDSSDESGNEIVLDYSADNDNINIAYGSWTTGTDYDSVGTSISDSQWHHVAVVVADADANANNVSIYVDGNLEEQGTSNNNSDDYDVTRLGDWIGEGSQGGQHSPKATLDEFRIWSDVRTKEEIQDNMNRKLSNDNLTNDTSGDYDNLLAYYPFNQGDANQANPFETTLVDYSGNGHNGKLIGFALTGTTSNWVDDITNYTTLPGGAFVTEWTVTADDLDITIPINGAYNYDFSVDWGDGTNAVIVTNDPGDAALTHTYANADTPYTVTITGDFPAIRFLDSSEDNRKKITAVSQWGTMPWESQFEAFFSCENMDVTAQDAPDLSNITSLQSMFNSTGITGENTDFSLWDVSNIQNISFMFISSENFKGDNIGNWNVSNVQQMLGTFDNASAFNQDLSGWNLQSLTAVGETMETMGSTFVNSGMDCNNYANTLIGWADNDNIAEDITLVIGDYATSAKTAISDLVAKGWTITGTEISQDDCEDRLSISDEVFSSSISVNNPVTSVLTINGPAGFELKEATLYTILGKEVLTSTSTTINASKLSTGLYVLKIENTEGLIATKKIVKQ
ncbi:LamG-like jellyroll fold domain-containing protein [Flavivirga aquimarina]|uniref:LamG-like jellyroll fold domain-containing protein n=1 Tax=Flavivirga aquimarina TaxID=2027862 RepID=A0ABT8W8U0_9FLAO|nr:LamG-like jellyroll fold domain-containing protein [Flavivirga aquimarina]MDO5969546.1 LamG-like jellyroll fold domain-containing protein [Flavivirga aquimarina]